MDSPTLTTDRLQLRPVTMEDIEFIFTLFAAPETNLYSSYDDLKTIEEAKEMYETYLKPGFPTHFRLLIELKDSKIPLGTLGLYLYSEKNSGHTQHKINQTPRTNRLQKRRTTQAETLLWWSIPGRTVLRIIENRLED